VKATFSTPVFAILLRPIKTPSHTPVATANLNFAPMISDNNDLEKMLNDRINGFTANWALLNRQKEIERKFRIDTDTADR
jgi:hypothetical protein